MGSRVGAALTFVWLVGCAPSAPPLAAKSIRTAQTVSSIVLVNHCASLGTANAKLAESEMNQLVEGCSGFTGGTARFTATLLPGGAIQFEPGPEKAETIPICVLSRPLKHGVHLTKSCSLDVQLEVSSMILPSAPAH